jgi:excisionase family DNA binding protein
MSTATRVSLAALADDDLLTPGEVGALFRANPKTVTRWAQSGRLPSVKTPGGHRRFRVLDIRRALSGQGPPG